MTYVGGFNPSGTIDSNTNINYNLGDIFISALGQPVANPSYSSLGSGDIPGTSADYSNNGNGSTPGYAYAIHLGSVTNGVLSYSILALNSGTQLLSTEFGVNQVSNPYAVDISKGSYTDLYDGTASVQNLTNSGVNQLLGESLFGNTGSYNPQNNYAVSFDISTLLSNASTNDPSLLTSGLALVETEQCGNDLLAGAVSPLDIVATPEPSSWALGLIALGGVIYLRRRARST